MNAASRRARILAIDDDPSMLGLLKMHLENAGYEVLLAADGIAGGHLALSAAPDLVLVDVMMPWLSGYDLVEALKTDPATRHIPVVFLTSDDEVEERSGKLGAEAYLKKPVDADRLLEVIALFAG
jgi:twitching motility two-component system response regulator PilH